MCSTLRTIAVLSYFFSAAFGFSFTAGSPTQCDDLNVSWIGGTAPFLLLMTPQYGIPRNISIPSSAFSDGKGSYSVQLPFAENHKFLLTMSDSTSFGSGGSTGILTVGPSLGGSCNTTDPNIAFSYELNSALQQCRPYIFSGYTSAVQPVTIMGIIPGGQSFVLKPPTGPTSYSWTTNVYNGTSLIFVMIDATSRQGGSSDFYTVVSSDDTSCINKNSPSSTIGSAGTTSPTSTTSTSASASSTPSTTPVGAIAGTVLGALIFLAVTITLGLFFLRKRRDSTTSWDTNGFRRNSHRVRSQVDLVSDHDSPSTPYHYPLPANNSGNPPNSALPFLPPFSHSDSGHLQPLSPAHDTSSLHSQTDPFSPADSFTDRNPFTARHSTQPPMSAAHRKAAMAGVSSYKPSRFILHTDIEDTVPPETEGEVVELPPQYTERRKGSGPSAPGQSNIQPQFASSSYHPPTS